MQNVKATDRNYRLVKKAEDALYVLLNEVLRPGVYGTSSLEITVLDGTISRIARRVEHIEK